MSKLNIKTGDTVLVIAGKDNGKVSTVKSVSPKTNKVLSKRDLTITFPICGFL